MWRDFGLTVIVALTSPAYAATPVDGQWIMKVDRFGNPEYSTLTLRTDGPLVSGDWDGDAAKGSWSGSALSLTVTDAHGATYRFEGRLIDGTLRGIADYPDNNFADTRLRSP